jgi:hypothetical protein
MHYLLKSLFFCFLVSSYSYKQKNTFRINPSHHLVSKEDKLNDNFQSEPKYNFLNPRTFIVSTLIASSILFPAGNIYSALDAIVKSNGAAALCVLDTRKADDFHDSCQLLDNVVRFRAGHILTFRQDWGGSKSTGSAIWNGANMAGWYLENKLGRNNLQNTRIIELGAGVGYTSILAKELGAGEVVITDGDEGVLLLSDKNIRINIPPEQLNSIKTARLRWNTPDESNFIDPEKPWDYILVADCTYKKSAWPDLVSSIVNLSGPQTISLVASEPRSVGEVEGFLAEVEKQGLTWREEKLPIDAEKDMCNLQCARLFSLQKKASI